MARAAIERRAPRGVFSRKVKEYPADGTKLHDYEAFLAIVEVGNLTRAAARLRRSLQSVSRSLAALEEQLGVVLIRRTTRTAEPTETGRALYTRVSAALRDLGRAEAEARDATESLTGAIRLAGSAYFVGAFVVPAIREFSIQHPGVTFDLRIAEHYAEHVRSGVDLMLRLGHLAASPLKTRKLAALRRVAVASPEYLAQRGRPEHPSDLARHACIVRTSAQDARTWTFQSPDGIAQRVTVDGPFEADNAYVTNQAVLAGLGIGVAPFFQVQSAIEAGAAEVVLEDFTIAPIPVHAVWPSEGRTPARVRRFIDLLAQRLKKASAPLTSARRRVARLGRRLRRRGRGTRRIDLHRARRRRRLGVLQHLELDPAVSLALLDGGARHEWHRRAGAARFETIGSDSGGDQEPHDRLGACPGEGVGARFVLGRVPGHGDLPDIRIVGHHLSHCVENGPRFRLRRGASEGKMHGDQDADVLIADDHSLRRASAGAGPRLSRAGVADVGDAVAVVVQVRTSVVVLETVAVLGLRRTPVVDVGNAVTIAVEGAVGGESG